MANVDNATMEPMYMANPSHNDHELTSGFLASHIPHMLRMMAAMHKRPIVAASREDTQFKMFFMSNDCSVEDSPIVNRESSVVVVDFNEGGPVVPSVDGHVVG